MIGFRVYWDAESQTRVNRMQDEFEERIEDLMDRLADSFGEEGVRYIKPQVRGNGRWQRSTGATERGIEYSVSRRGNTWTVNYLGNNFSRGGQNVAHMIDVGNFTPSQVIHASTYGYRAFPISARAGEINIYLSKIHGMGHSSPEYPKNFSEKGVDYLYNNVDRIAQRHLEWFMNRWVG